MNHKIELSLFECNLLVICAYEVCNITDYHTKQLWHRYLCMNGLFIGYKHLFCVLECYTIWNDNTNVILVWLKTSYSIFTFCGFHILLDVTSILLCFVLFLLLSFLSSFFCKLSLKWIIHIQHHHKRLMLHIMCLTIVCFKIKKLR